MGTNPNKNEGKHANKTCWRQEVAHWDKGPNMHDTSSLNKSYKKLRSTQIVIVRTIPSAID